MGPNEYLVGQIFGHLGVALTRGRLTDFKLGHLGVQIFGNLGKRPSLELGGQVREQPYEKGLAGQIFARYHKEGVNMRSRSL